LQLGYANTLDSNAVKRLERGEAPTTVKIDYCFNEVSYEREALSLDGEETIQVYGLTDLLAEKLRAIIQQVLDTFHKKAAGCLEAELLQRGILHRSDIMQASGKECALLRDEVL